jgi:hypothetical protein
MAGQPSTSRQPDDEEFIPPSGTVADRHGARQKILPTASQSVDPMDGHYRLLLDFFKKATSEAAAATVKRTTSGCRQCHLS